MAVTITEEKLNKFVKHFGNILESQLNEILPEIPEIKLHRILYKMWKKNLVRWGGPDDAYVMPKSGSDSVDMLYADCIWVLLYHADTPEDILTSYSGRDFVKISYFSRAKQSNYNIVYIANEDDYHKVSFLNSKYASLIEDDMITSTRFFFVSEDADLLRNMPLSKFGFPHLCIKLDFQDGRYKKPVLVEV